MPSRSNIPPRGGKKQSSRPARKAAAGPRPARRQDLPPRIKWRGFRPQLDSSGKEVRRPFKLETLASALTHMIETGADPIVTPAVQQALGVDEPGRLHFEFIDESKKQLLFQVSASVPRGRQTTLLLFVSKGGGIRAEAAAKEFESLRALHERVPSQVIRVYRGGNIFLPDRRRRHELGRSVFAFTAKNLPGYHTLGVSGNLQFVENSTPPHTFTKKETALLKGQAIEAMAASYDAATRSAMALPDVTAGEFAVRRRASSEPRLMLIACRGIMQPVTPVKLLERILEASWVVHEQPFRLAPEDPEVLVEALQRARGKEDAKEWIRAYLKLPPRRDETELTKLYREALAELAGVE